MKAATDEALAHPADCSGCYECRPDDYKTCRECGGLMLSTVLRPTCGACGYYARLTPHRSLPTRRRVRGSRRR